MKQSKQLILSALLLTAFVGTSSFAMQPTLKEKVAAGSLGTYAGLTVLKFVAPYVSPVTALATATYVGYKAAKGFLSVEINATKEIAQSKKD